MTNYPKWFLPTLLITLLVMLISGLLLAPTTLDMRLEIEVPWHLPGTLRTPVAALHAIGGFTLMLLIGALWSVHMRSGWRRHKLRRSGTVLGLTMLLLTISAVGVYYLGDDGLGSSAAAVHLVLGLLCVVPFGVHWVRGHRTRRQQRRAARRAKAATIQAAGPSVSEASA